MPGADVVVVGAGLAGLTAGIALADAGARVELVARGHAATHWSPGGIDVAALAGMHSTAAGVERLAALPGHPYAILRGDVRAAVAFVRDVVAAEGMTYLGEIDEPLRTVPTAIGGTRRVGIVPDGQGRARDPWAPDERLIVCGIEGFKDFWPGPIAASLARPGVWAAGGVPAGSDERPARVQAVTVALPGQSGRRSVNALELGQAFDDPAWRRLAFDMVARASSAGGGGPARIALPAVLGLDDHAAVLRDARDLLPYPVFEVPLVPPSLPGLRLYRALRAAFLRRGGRMSIGEPVLRIEATGAHVKAVILSAAVRERRIRTGALVLATGGIAGGGLVGTADGRVVEPVLELAVEAPAVERWLADEALDPAGHPLERAGIRADANLRPLDAGGAVRYENVAVVGALLAGQRAVAERCGDGVSIASGWRAAAVLGGIRAAGPAPADAPPPAQVPA